MPEPKWLRSGVILGLSARRSIPRPSVSTMSHRQVPLADSPAQTVADEANSSKKLGWGDGYGY